MTVLENTKFYESALTDIDCELELYAEVRSYMQISRPVGSAEGSFTHILYRGRLSCILARIKSNDPTLLADLTTANRQNKEILQ